MSRPLVTKPSLNDVLRQFENNIFADFNCHRIGIIQKLNTSNFTATIQLVDLITNKTWNGTDFQSFPLLSGCPVFMPCDVDKGVTFPIEEGKTEVLVCFNDRDIDKWFSNGQANQQPNSARMHDLSDGMAIVGFRSLLRPLTNYNPNATELKYGTTLVSLDDKVKIENATKNLKTLIDSLITTLQALKTVNGMSEYPIDAVTNTALANLKTEFDALLK